MGNGKWKMGNGKWELEMVFMDWVCMSSHAQQKLPMLQSNMAMLLASEFIGYIQPHPWLNGIWMDAAVPMMTFDPKSIVYQPTAFHWHYYILYWNHKYAHSLNMSSSHILRLEKNKTQVGSMVHKVAMWTTEPQRLPWRFIDTNTDPKIKLLQ